MFENKPSAVVQSKFIVIRSLKSSVGMGYAFGNRRKSSTRSTGVVKATRSLALRFKGAKHCNFLKKLIFFT